MYRLLQRCGPNWGRSNFIPGFPLHLPWPPLSFPGPYALCKKIILITFGTDHVWTFVQWNKGLVKSDGSGKYREETVSVSLVLQCWLYHISGAGINSKEGRITWNCMKMNTNEITSYDNCRHLQTQMKLCSWMTLIWTVCDALSKHYNKL